MTTSLTRAAGLCALLATTCLTEKSIAQGIKPPPRQEAVSPTGVNYKSGSFSYQQRDLSIGGGEFPTGLTLDRVYSSGLDELFSGIPSQGWTHNLMVKFSMRKIPNLLPPQDPPLPDRWLYSFTFGGKSASFTGGSTNPPGGFVGTYKPTFQGGEALVFTGTEDTGTFTLYGSDGTTIIFNSRQQGIKPTKWIAPDGTTLDYTYDGDRIRSVFSNRGYALIAEGNAWTKACVVNLAQTYVTPTSACPAGAQAVTYGYSPSPTYSGRSLLTTAANAVGETTTYSYIGADHLGCVKVAGQSSCKISNEYNVCRRKASLASDPAGLRLLDSVIRQETATGETYSYSFPTSPICPEEFPPESTSVTMTSRLNEATFVSSNRAGLPITVTDPLQRTTSISYYPSLASLPEEQGKLGGIKLPEQNATSLAMDTRGNITEQRTLAKTNSGLAEIVIKAGYSLDCANRKTCNKPDYIIDAIGNTTNYTYAPEHGGVLTETGPAVNGFRPQKRYVYAQRSAWLKNAVSGYSAAASPVWLLVQEAFCKTGAASGNGCAIAGDEAVTTYDYGPDSGPNNLLLRGIITDAGPGGLNLRTCYAYDQAGNRISETSPKAGLSSCQ